MLPDQKQRSSEEGYLSGGGGPTVQEADLGLETSEPTTTGRSGVAWGTPGELRRGRGRATEALSREPDSLARSAPTVRNAGYRDAVT